MKVSILGTGAYGLSLAVMFHENKCDIKMWTKFEAEKEMLVKDRTNEKLLPGIIIPKSIKITTNMEEAVSDAELIVVAVPAAFVDSTVQELKSFVNPKQHFCIATKGIEQNTCRFPVAILKKYIKTKRVCVISGPSFAIDIANKVPIGLSLATVNKSTERIMKESLQNKYLKLRTSDDMLGVSMCGAIKNVIAIASGMLEGMKMPESTQAMFITESVNDIKNLIKALGGNDRTIHSFAGFGDLMMTCTSTKSRNFKFGHLIGSGASKKEIEEYASDTTVEGLYTLKSIYKLLNKKKVKMPIIDMIYAIIFGEENPKILLSFLNTKE